MTPAPKRTPLLIWLLTTLLLLPVPLLSQANNAVQDEAFRTTSSMRDETLYVVQCIERIHYANTPIAQMDTKEFLRSYMADLDLLRLFFLQSDFESFQERFAPALDIYLHQGSLLPAFDIFKTYRQRVQERVSWIQQRLQEDLPLDSDLTYNFDRKNAPWPATTQEADDLWNRLLKYELINEILGASSTEARAALQAEIDPESTLKDTPATTPDATLTDEDRLQQAKTNIANRYQRILDNANETDPQEVQETFLTSLTRMYDPHSTFLSPDSLEDFSISIRNSLVGIGAILGMEDGYCTIRELIPGGPADKSNLLHPNDKIVGVAQGEGEIVDVIGQKLRRIVKMIRGKEGSTVRLLIQPGAGDPSDRSIVTLVREQIELTAKLAKASIHTLTSETQTHHIGVIELPAFYGSGEGQAGTTRDVEELIGKLKDARVDGIVLDLRRNGGGLLSEAVDLAGLFIPIGPVVQVRDSLGRIDEHADRNPKVVWDGPLLVLVSRFSASASEIVAGALRNHRRALVVGDRSTHGKGTVQAILEMDRPSVFRPNQVRRGAAKITVQKWYLPDGNSTQLQGVPADIPLPSINHVLPIGEDDLPNALRWDAIEPLPSFTKLDILSKTPSLKPYLIDGDLTETLASKSQVRQEHLDEFALLKERIAWFEKDQKNTEITLNLEQRKAQREQDMQLRDALDKRMEDLAKENYPSSEVLLNLSLAKAEESRLAHKDSEKEPSAEKAASPRFDIHLRESLRIMADWLDLLDSKPESPQIAASLKGQEAARVAP